MAPAHTRPFRGQLLDAQGWSAVTSASTGDRMVLLGGDSEAAIMTPLDNRSPMMVELGSHLCCRRVHPVAVGAPGEPLSPGVAEPVSLCCQPWGSSSTADPAPAVMVRRQHLTLKELTFHQHLF